MVAVYEEALAKLPDNPRLMYGFASSVFRAELEDLYPKALELNQKVKELDPEMEMGTVYNLINYYSNIDDTGKLIETFEEAIAREPDSAGLMNYYASTIVSKAIESHYDRGIEVVKKAIELNDQSSSYWYTLAQLYEKKGAEAEAVEAAKRALAIRPDYKPYQIFLEKLEGEG
jgi:tetratricopeptide (TPR) repeat protein